MKNALLMSAVLSALVAQVSYASPKCPNGTAVLLACDEGTQPNDAFSDISMAPSFDVCSLGAGKVELVGVGSYGASLKGAKAPTPAIQYDFASSMGNSAVSVTQISGKTWELIVEGDAESFDVDGKVRSAKVRLVRTYECVGN